MIRAYQIAYDLAPGKSRYIKLPLMTCGVIWYLGIFRAPVFWPSAVGPKTVHKNPAKIPILGSEGKREHRL